MLATKTVYGLYFPETRRIVDALWSERPHALYERNYTKAQDAMHGPFLARWRAWVSAAGVALGDGFVHEYPTAGANEGITALMARIATSEGSRRPRIHVFNGEYEGYLHVAAAMSVETSVHSRDPESYTRSLRQLARPNDWFLVSQPSAIDGCVWEGFASFVAWMGDAVPDVRLAVDLTYVGAVAGAYAIDVRAPNIDVLFASLSKPFGVYYHRIGALFARRPIVGLSGNLWFKNLFSLALGERLMAAHDARDLPSRYLGVQRNALERCVAAGAIDAGARPSDVVLLASARLSPGCDPAPHVREFVRARSEEGALLRFCLTPAMDALIREETAP
jgi:hypothetical protein